MLSCQQLAGHKAGAEPVYEGGVVQWLLANDGSLAWPQGTTLRLVGGPALMDPIVEIPPAEPGQTLEVNLEVKHITPDKSEESRQEVAYCLVTPCGQPFGDLLTVQIAPAQTKELPLQPVCIMLRGPADGGDSGVEALQGELKVAQWTLANVSGVPWPEDAHCELFYNTPGFAHLPGNVDIPEGVCPGMTVEVTIPIKMPEQPGRFQAMWAVVSPSIPEFGEILVAEFNVGEFPFMEWMLLEEAIADKISENASEIAEIEAPEKSKLSAAHVMHRHLLAGDCNITYDEISDDAVMLDVVSLGHISALAAGTTWILEVALTNDGAMPWPEDTMLRCCAGDGFGCKQVHLESLNPGETGMIQMELQIPELSSKCAWTLTTGVDGYFGPVLVLNSAGC